MYQFCSWDLHNITQENSAPSDFPGCALEPVEGECCTPRTLEQTMINAGVLINPQ